MHPRDNPGDPEEEHPTPEKVPPIDVPPEGTLQPSPREPGDENAQPS